MHKTGEMVAIQTENGEVYMGFVTEVHPEGTFDVDLVADNTYRSRTDRKVFAGA